MKNRKEKPSLKLFSSGQALIEFALALPLLLLLVLGALEFGRAFQTKIVLENAAREGVHNFIYDKGDVANGFTNTKTAIIAEATNTGVNITDSDITITCFNDSNGDGLIDSSEVVATCSSGSTIDASITVDFELAVIGAFMDPLPISSNARMYVP